MASLGRGGLSNPFNWLPGLWATSVSLAADLQSSEGRKKLGRRAAGKCFPICPSTANPLHLQGQPCCRGLEGSRMKGDGTKAERDTGKAKPWGQERARSVLAPHVHRRVVPKVIFGFWQMLQISQGVSVCVVSAHILGKRKPRPALLVVCRGKAAKWGKHHQGSCLYHTWTGCLIQSLEQGLDLSPCDRLEASLHPFSISYELLRCFLMP